MKAGRQEEVSSPTCAHTVWLCSNPGNPCCQFANQLMCNRLGQPIQWSHSLQGLKRLGMLLQGEWAILLNS